MTDIDDDSVAEVSDFEDEDKEVDRGAFTPITSGVGFNLLKRMGWSEGKGCGVQEQGRSHPVWAAQKADSGGLCELCALGECEIHGRRVSAMALAISLLPARKKQEEYVHHVKLANKKITEAVKNKSSTAEVEFEVNGPKVRRARVAVKLRTQSAQNERRPTAASEDIVEPAGNDNSFDLYDMTATPLKRSAEDDLYFASDEQSNKKSRSLSDPKAEVPIDYDALSSLLNAIDPATAVANDDVCIIGSSMPSEDALDLSSADLTALLQMVNSSPNAT